MSGEFKDRLSREDDIDLTLLLKRFLAFARQFKWVFLAAILLGLLSGYLRYRSLPVVYQSRMILQSDALTNQDNIEIVSNWNALLKSGETGELATLLGTRPAIVSKVKEIKAEEIQKIFSSNNPNGFLLHVLVTDNGVLPELQQGIVRGFGNSPFAQAKMNAKRQRLQQLISKVENEVSRLETAKRQVDEILDGKSGQSSFIVDPSGISRQLIEMNEKLLFYREEHSFVSAVQVLQGFHSFKSPAGPRLFVWLFLGLLAWLSVAFLYTLISSLRRKLRLIKIQPVSN